jgi:plastocyanin
MKKAFALLAIIAAAIGLVACGGGDDNSTSNAAPAASTPTGGGGGAAAGGGGGGAQTLVVKADPTGQLSWSPTKETAKAGSVTMTLDNPSPVSHDIEIEGNGVEKKADLVSQGSTSVTATLKPGTYEYYCTVPGHKEAGMDGTLTVE